MRGLLRDVRFGLRRLGKAPGFTALAVLTLALGVGANTAIFSLVRAILLEPLPYRQAERIVQVWPDRLFSQQLFEHFERRLGTLEDLAAYLPQRLSLLAADGSEEIAGNAVSPSYFRLLGVEAALGRTFRPEEREPGRGAVAVLSHQLWRERFGGDPGIVGETIDLEGPGATRRVVVGVLPAGFEPLVEGTRAWVPLTFDPGDAHDYGGMINLRALARLRPGIGHASAGAEVRALAGALPEEFGAYYRDRAESAGVTPLRAGLVAEARPTLWLLFGAVGMVLLIACVNVTNLLLARAGGRHREVAVQSALGASRWRVLRQLLTESALLGLLGGAAGLLLAAWTQSLLVRRLLTGLPRGREVGLAAPELAFCLGVGLAASLLAGLAPALSLTGRRGRSPLAGLGRSTLDAAGRQRLNRLLVAVEVGLAVMLVVAASLMIESLRNLGKVDPGFAAEEVVGLRLKPPASRYPDAAARQAYFAEVVETVGRLPGVSAVGAIDHLPVTPGGALTPYSVTESPDPAASPPYVSFCSVWPGTAHAAGIPLLAGRALSLADRADAPPVGLVNRAFVDRHWPGGDAVGRKLYWGDGSPWLTIVGVVGDVPQNRLDREPAPEVYLPLAQAPVPLLYLTVRRRGPAPAAAGLVAAVRAVDPQVPVGPPRTLSQVVDGSLDASRSFSLLLVAFAVLALALGAVGVYGVGSYAVAQRTREIGVRLALGAVPAALLRRLLGQQMLPVAIGIAAGLAGAVAAGRLLASRLFGVSSSEPRVLLAVAVTLALVGLAAVYLPARRAAAVDPAVALRE